MKRLRRDGHVKADTSAHPYLYFPAASSMRSGSTKAPHFLSLADFFIDCCSIDPPRLFEIEPKLGDKGSIEPDIFMMWQGVPFFVEIQRNVYSKQVMNKKIERYQDYFYSDQWRELGWQGKRKLFPYIWIITDHTYKIESGELIIHQSKGVQDFIQQTRPKTSGIKMNVGNMKILRGN